MHPRIRPVCQVLLLAVSFLFVSRPVDAVKFELVAETYPKPKWSACCGSISSEEEQELTSLSVWNFASAHSLVIVTANSPPQEGQRIDIEILDGSERGNVYLSKRDIRGETRLAITTHESADVGVCLTNHLEGANHKSMRTVDLDIDIGADAVDYNAIANQESLSILEVEMRKLEAVTKEIVDEMGYLQRREQRMRDTNESTNERVRKFAIMMIIGIVGLGAWQLVHLRSFFKKKYLID